MDKPFGGIDEMTRRPLQDERLNLQKRVKENIVFVRHEIEKTYRLWIKNKYSSHYRFLIDYHGVD